MESFKSLILTCVVIAVAGISFLLIYPPPSGIDPNKQYTVIGVIVESTPEPLDGDLYKVKWSYRPESLLIRQSGTAITSYKDIKTGDKVLIRADDHLWLVTKWIPSGVTSW